MDGDNHAGKKDDYMFSTKLRPGPVSIDQKQIGKRWRKHVKQKLGIDVDFYPQKHLNTTVVDFLSSIQKAEEEAAKLNSHTSPVMVRSEVYKEHHISTIDHKWLAWKMKETRTKAKEIIKNTGVDKTNVCAWISGVRSMSQVTKAMLFYYFKDKERLTESKEPEDTNPVLDANGKLFNSINRDYL